MKPFDSGLVLRILARGQAISADFPENDVWQASPDGLRAQVFRDEGSTIFSKRGLLGNVLGGSVPRLVQAEDKRGCQKFRGFERGTPLSKKCQRLCKPQKNTVSVDASWEDGSAVRDHQQVPNHGLDASETTYALTRKHI